MMEIIQDPASSLLAETAKMVDDGLSRPSGEKTIPTILLYDERGLRLYDIITTDTPDYYLFRAEEQILKDHADEIIKIMRGTAVAGERVLELGAGYANFGYDNTRADLRRQSLEKDFTYPSGTGSLGD